jgi:indolepyruvate ferredoxin oxidoreductase alpha subunit
MKKIMSGNEAIARGAWEAGVHFAAAYPGTPSTEILENAARYAEIDAQWSSNEKVALEVGLGAALAGSRVLVAMKHVGVNVAADPLMTLSYTGINGGLVLVAADDPGMHSSQNEQDSRHYARLGKVPMLEPSDSQEAKEMVGVALDLSEEYDTPVMLKSSTRISHAQSLVTLADRREVPIRPYIKDMRKYVMIPAFGRPRHVVVEERMVRLRALADKLPLNRIEWRDRSLGVICAGICYQYVREALPEASVLKIGMCYPLPAGLIREFAAGVDKLYVVEELDPFMEEQIKAMGIPVLGKELFPLVGEISPNIVAKKITGHPLSERLEVPGYGAEEIPMRPPVLCPGCAHRGVFYILGKLKLVASGDIGCYTLGCLPPLEGIDTCICMGASVSGALGMEKGNPGLKGRVVGVVGDSTFFHSGLTGIADIVYNRGTVLTMVLDNRTTAMTGHQHHPGSGQTLKGEPTVAIDIGEICRALGVKRVSEVDPFDLAALEKAIRTEVAAGEPSVLVVRRPCILQDKSPKDAYDIDPDRCVDCGLCMKLGCPALSRENELMAVDPVLCTGCGFCVQVCKKDAIVKGG